jgi:hypothetical protein
MAKKKSLITSTPEEDMETKTATSRPSGVQAITCFFFVCDCVAE